MHGKTKLKLENENYRDEKCVTQAAWMKRTNENYERESIQIKSITMNCMQTKKKFKTEKMYTKQNYTNKKYTNGKYTNDKYANAKK